MEKFQSLYAAETLEQLKKAYRKLALIFHPDKGGNHEDMANLNNLFEKLFKAMKANENAENRTTVTAQQFTEIIDKLMKFDLDIEIVGSWLWVGGNTFACKDIIKELGFKWAAKKKLWFLSDGTPKKSKKNFSYDDIKNIYGAETIKKSKGQALLS